MPSGRKDPTKAERSQRYRQMVEAIKLAAGCADCGFDGFGEALDFDHMGDDKMLAIGVMVNRGYGMPAILNEIAKCEVVCANCHRKRTWERRNV